MHSFTAPKCEPGLSPETPRNSSSLVQHGRKVALCALCWGQQEHTGPPQGCGGELGPQPIFLLCCSLQNPAPFKAVPSVCRPKGSLVASQESQPLVLALHRPLGDACSLSAGRRLHSADHKEPDDEGLAWCSDLVPEDCRTRLNLVKLYLGTVQTPRRPATRGTPTSPPSQELHISA